MEGALRPLYPPPPDRPLTNVSSSRLPPDKNPCPLDQPAAPKHHHLDPRKRTLGGPTSNRNPGRLQIGIGGRLPIGMRGPASLESAPTGSWQSPAIMTCLATARPVAPTATKAFTDVWSAAGCVVPWLDGVNVGPLMPDRHRLTTADKSWAVFAVNTSNWSHILSELPEPLKAQWNRIPNAVAEDDGELADKIRAQLQDLIRFDMARVSPEQLEALREIVKATPGPDHGRQLRIASWHHHLRAPTLREEVKAFADISNLQQLRAFLSGERARHCVARPQARACDLLPPHLYREREGRSPDAGHLWCDIRRGT